MGEYIPETANAWSKGYIHLENTRYNKIFLSLSRFFLPDRWRRALQDERMCHYSRHDSTACFIDDFVDNCSRMCEVQEKQRYVRAGSKLIWVDLPGRRGEANLGRPWSKFFASLRSAILCETEVDNNWPVLNWPVSKKTKKIIIPILFKFCKKK